MDTAEQLFALADTHDPFDVGACCAQLGSNGDNYTACLAAPPNGVPSFELLLAPPDRQIAAGVAAATVALLATLVLLAVKLAQWRAAIAGMGLQAQRRPLLQPPAAAVTRIAGAPGHRCVL